MKSFDINVNDSKAYKIKLRHRACLTVAGATDNPFSFLFCRLYDRSKNTQYLQL